MYQREANKNKHGIGKHCEEESWILMTKLNERTNKQRTNDRRSNFRQRLNDGNIFTRLLIEVKFYENTYPILPSSSQIPLVLYVTVNSLLMTKIGIVK